VEKKEEPINKEQPEERNFLAELIEINNTPYDPNDMKAFGERIKKLDEIFDYMLGKFPNK